MPEVTNDELIARLEKLERENKRLKRIGAVGLIFAAALFVMAQTPARSRTLEAERLVIRYANGKDAIVFGTFKDARSESALAHFFRPDGSMGAFLTTGTNGNSFHVLSPNKQIEIELRAGSTVGPPDFVKPTGEFASFGISRGALPSFHLSTDTTGETTQYMYAENGSQLRLTNGPDGAGLELWDNPKILRAVLGRTNLETSRTGIVESRPLSSLVLFDKDGKVLWRAP